MKNFFKINRALVAKKKFFTLTLALMATISLWAEITCKTIDNSSGEVYLVTSANMATYYDSGNGWVTNASGGEISSSSYYSSKSGGNNTNYIDPETETSGTKAQASIIEVPVSILQEQLRLAHLLPLLEVAEPQQ